MPIETEIFEGRVVKILRQNNAFRPFSVNHDQYVTQGKIVHVPRENVNPAVVLNRAVFPGTATQLTDQDLTYTLQDLSTDPTFILLREELQTGYDKTNSVIDRHATTLADLANHYILQSWVDTVTVNGGSVAFPVGNIIDTTGGANPFNGHNNITLSDLVRLKRAMDLANIPDDGKRMLLMHPDMYYSFFNIQAAYEAQGYGQQVLPEGVIRKFLGFNVLLRSFTPAYNNAGNLKAIGAAALPTDRMSCVAWHPDAVATALGAVNLFPWESSPTYYGDVFSAQVFFGGIRLKDEGVLVLRQG